MINELIFSFLVILVVNLLLFFFIKKINFKIKKKYKRKIKIKINEPLSIGGIFFFLNFLMISFFDYNYNLLNFFSFNYKIFFFIFCLLVFFIGLFDDILDLSPWRRLILLTVASYLALNYLDLNIEKIYVDFFEFSFKIDSFSVIFTILCILTFINFNNMYDGINGQSCFYYIIIFIFLISKNLAPIYLSFFLIFFLFFSIYNLKNKIYLGDSGIYIISIIISVFFIFGFKNNIIFLSEMICIFFVPFIDMIRLIFARLLKFENPFKGDHNHYHHILSKKLNKITVLSLLHLPPLISLIILKFSYAFFLPLLLINISLYVGFYTILSEK